MVTENKDQISLAAQAPDNEKAAREDYRTRINSKLIDALERGVAPWQKPWDPRVDLMPFNPVTKLQYKGINNLALAMEGQSDPRWLTYKQAAAMGAQVRKGEKGSQIEYWKHTDTRDKLDQNGNIVIGADGKPQKETFRLERPQVFYATVFNASQIDNMPQIDLPGPRTFEWDISEKAEAILQASGAKIAHDQANRAFYSVSKDEIHLPDRAQFKSPEAYYGTALHELGHWTGHQSRLGRDLSGSFGSISYAKEELRAEISSYLMADKVGIPHYPERHASYVASWIEVLENDKNEIFRASRDAERITDYVIDLEHQRGINQEQGIPNDVSKKAHELPGASKVFFKEGGKAAAQGLMYSENPYEKGSKEHLSWSQGHNEMRAKKASIREKTSAFESPKHELSKDSKLAIENTILAVSFKDKEAAKEAGARWDKDHKFWFAPKGVDLSKLEKWLPKQEAIPQAAVSNPEVEFANALRANGLVIDGLPIMDGKMHRVAVEGKGPQSKDGAYVGFLDGQPSGFIQNHVTGIKTNWSQSGVEMTPEERAHLQAQTQINKEIRAQELLEKHTKAADYAVYKWNKLSEPSAHQLSPYLERKGVPAFGIKFDGDKTIIPVRDLDGNLKSLQTIAPGEGEPKKFLKGSKKEGHFHVIVPTIAGGVSDFSAKHDALKDIAQGETIFVAEGYATGASVALATAKPVVIAFDAGNFAPVVAGLKERFPNNPIYIAADNDHEKKNNVGMYHAAMVGVAQQVGVIYPDMKGAKGSDFNDLAKASGNAEVKRQIEAGLAKTLGGPEKGLTLPGFKFGELRQSTTSNKELTADKKMVKIAGPKKQQKVDLGR